MAMELIRIFPSVNDCAAKWLRAEMKRTIAYRREEKSKSKRNGISIFLLVPLLTKGGFARTAFLY